MSSLPNNLSENQIQQINLDAQSQIKRQKRTRYCMIGSLYILVSTLFTARLFTLEGTFFVPMESSTKDTTQAIHISKMNDLLFQLDLYMILNMLEYYSTLIYIFISFVAFDHVPTSYGNCIWRKPLFAV